VSADDIARLLDADPTPPEKPVVKFLCRKDVAAYIGLRSDDSLAKVDLPPHDVELGRVRGWRPETIDAWIETRPGKGRWGARINHRRGGALS
jgi:predicted DNA-binding transcriptional regulator AlpA